MESKVNTNIIDMNNYLIVEKGIQKNEDTTDIKEKDGMLIIKQSYGINSTNFTIKKSNSNLKLHFSFFKINGIHYINIDNTHIIDYKKFIKIQQISKIDEKSIKIRNLYIGEIVLEHCDVEIFSKALNIMNTFMKSKKNFISDAIYTIMN